MEFYFWTENIKQKLLFFSDILLQRKSWVEGDPNHISWGWEDEVSELFDSFFFEEYLDNNKKKIPTKLFDSLIKLKNELDNYEPKEADEEIINDPNWLEIVKLAKETLAIWDKESF